MARVLAGRTSLVVAGAPVVVSRQALRTAAHAVRRRLRVVRYRCGGSGCLPRLEDAHQAITAYARDVPASNPVWTWLRSHPVVADGLAAAVLLVGVVLVPDPEQPMATPLSAGAILVAALTCGTLAFRRRRPEWVLALVTLGTAAVVALTTANSLIVLAPMLALYTLSVRTNRRTTLIAWGMTVVAVTAGTALAVWSWPPDLGVLQHLPWLSVAAAVGDAVRTRRAYGAAVEERAERAERTRESEALRRVAEERLRIARELHDVVAHRIAVVNVQAAVASHLVDADRDGALSALGHVRDAGRAILDELSDILNVLRQPDERVDPTVPAPGLDQLDGLIESFTSAGLTTRWSITGPPRPLTPTVDLVAYRILQEALTNAHKHGAGSADVTISYPGSGVSLLVTNPLPSQEIADGCPAVSTDMGFGITGMRERAAAVGGHLSVAPAAEGRFRVEASLPDREPDQEPDQEPDREPDREPDPAVGGPRANQRMALS